MQNLLPEEIRKSVANCIQNRSILRVGSVGQRLADVHRNQGISSELICEMLLQAGISAGVPVEIDSPRPVTFSDSLLGRPEQNVASVRSSASRRTG